jgi:uncharacterized membrane protein YfcA
VIDGLGAFPLDTTTLLLLHAVGFVGFLVSSVLGVGGTMLLLPILVGVMPAAEAVALVSPVMLFNNVVKAFLFRRAAVGRAAVLVSITCVPVAYVAAGMAADVDEAVIKIGIALLILAALALERLGPTLGWRGRLTVSDAGLVGAGVVIGAASGLCGAAGAPTALAMRGYGLTREAFVGTIALMAIALQLGKIPAYVHSGLLRSDTLTLALSLCLVAGLSVPVGRAVLRRIDARRFRGWLDGLLFALALYLVLASVLPTAR